ncbi:hypothetical protein R6Q57_011217 [Mikania cordata]
MLNKEQSSAFVVMAMNWGYNFSKFILNEIKGNLKGSKSERFMMYHRFLQMIFDERFPDVYVVKLPEYEDVVTRDELDLDFNFEMETIPVESDLPEKVNLLTPENLVALLEHVKRSVGNPPPALSFANQEPPMDVGADLVPRKRRRDPLPGVIVSELENEPISVTQMQTITVEPTEPLPKFKESTAGSSSHTKDIDYDSFLAVETGTRADKGKHGLPDDEPIDVVKLQSRVFELEQDSLSHTLLIQELKTNNETKYKKIKDIETNMGHLSAIVFDLKQKLQDKLKGEFIDESSSSTVAEPAPEISRADFDELTRSHEEGLRK